MDGLRDRFRGVLLGVATGDALGAPLEFQPPRAAANQLTEMVGGGWLKLPPGQWTDDTELTVATVESLLERRRFDPDDIAERLARWYLSGPLDVGNHTAMVLRDIAGGKPWEQASAEAQQAQPESAANGSLMRAAPLALFFFQAPEHAASLSPVLSRITHAHTHCQHACTLYNVVVAKLLQGEPLDAAITGAMEACQEMDAAMRMRLDRVRLPENETSPTGWVLDTLEVALWSVWRSETFEDALVSAVNRGADADTVGAVAGGLAGALYGMSGIPQRWLSVLKERDRLLQMADALLELSCKP